MSQSYRHSNSCGCPDCRATERRERVSDLETALETKQRRIDVLKGDRRRLAADLDTMTRERDGLRRRVDEAEAEAKRLKGHCAITRSWDIRAMDEREIDNFLVSKFRPHMRGSNHRPSSCKDSGDGLDEAEALENFDALLEEGPELPSIAGSLAALGSRIADLEALDENEAEMRRGLEHRVSQLEEHYREHGHPGRPLADLVSPEDDTLERIADLEERVTCAEDGIEILGARR
jgi:predicted RNase H-like nuclease (RuvC/YqgF family)